MPKASIATTGHGARSWAGRRCWSTEDAGGGSISGQGIVDLSLVAHEFGAHAGARPARSRPMSSRPRCRASRRRASTRARAALGRRDRVVGALRAGPERRPRGGSTLEIRVAGVEVVLNGVKAPVESAASSSHLLVTGRTGDGVTQVLVPTDAPGNHVDAPEVRRPHSALLGGAFDDVRVPTAAVLGEVGGSGPRRGTAAPAGVRHPRGRRRRHDADARLR